MDSTMEGMLETYLFETNDLLDKLDEMLMKDEQEGDFSTDDVNEIFRIMHTIKGSSAMMEFTSISVIAHKIEDLFFVIRDKGIDFLKPQDKKDLFDLMFKSEDYLRGEVEKVENGEELLKDTSDFEKTIADFLVRIQKDEEEEEGKVPAASDNAKASASTDSKAASAPSDADHKLPEDPTAVKFIHVDLEEGVGMENLRAFMIVTALRDCDFDFREYPRDLATNAQTAQPIADNGFYLAFDDSDQCNRALAVLKTQAHIRSYEVIDSSKAEEKAAPAPAPEKAAASQKTSANAGPAKAPAPAAKANKPAPQQSHAPIKQSLISVNLQKLDALQNLVGEIVITESMVTSSPVLKMLPQEAFDSFTKSARQLRKLTNDLQDISMSLRMVSVSGVFQKMNRIVRDMTKKLNKDVRLTLVGEDTEVDKSIVDSIQDPIMHIVRNSMDHGIEETKEERIAAGKDPQGEIVLSAEHTSNEVIISCSDDGYGMDPQKMLDKAEEKGLLTKPRSEYTDSEALHLILLPGFSTNKEVTEYSGRGVGMDVVKRNVESVGGTVKIHSEKGKGTTITLKIPLTMAIVDGMKITVGDSIFTIPIADIQQSFKVTKDEIILDENGNEMIERMGEFYPVIRLDRFYGIPSLYGDNIEDGIMVWVENGDRSCVLYVDDLIGEQQVVVKPLPVYFNSFRLKEKGISGCSILGDGNICIILDIANIYAASIENA
jgi:two-component system chemotaxis sensor kinase CheA